MMEKRWGENTAQGETQQGDQEDLERVWLQERKQEVKAFHFFSFFPFLPLLEI